MTGIPSESNPLGLPDGAGCVDSRRFAFRIHRPHGRRVVRLDVYVNGRHTRTVKARHGHSIDQLVLAALPQGDFSVRIVAHTANGHRVVSVRRYHGCTKGPPHTLHNRHPRKQRRRPKHHAAA